MARSDARGQVAFEAIPFSSSYWILIEHRSYPVRRILHEVSSPGHSTFRVALESAVPPRVVEPRGSSRVLGRLLDEDYHLPIPGAEVTLWCPTLQVFRIVETDLNGDFILADLPGADDFVLYCEAPGFSHPPPLRFSLLPLSEIEVKASLTFQVNYIAFPGQTATDRKVAGGRTVIVNDPKTGEPRPHFF